MTEMHSQLHPEALSKIPPRPGVTPDLSAQCSPALPGAGMVTGVPPGRCSHIDPILQAMLASKDGVSSASLLSLRPAFRWVSRDILRYT
jgi:hypothetical protein